MLSMNIVTHVYMKGQLWLKELGTLSSSSQSYVSSDRTDSLVQIAFQARICLSNCDASFCIHGAREAKFKSSVGPCEFSLWIKLWIKFLACILSLSFEIRYEPNSIIALLGHHSKQCAYCLHIPLKSKVQSHFNPYCWTGFTVCLLCGPRQPIWHHGELPQFVTWLRPECGCLTHGKLPVGT